MSPSAVLREAGSQPPASRRIRRRPSASHVLIAVAVILAFILNLLVLQDRDESVLVVIADESLPAGGRLTAAQIRLAPVGADFEGLGGLVTDSDLAAVDGWVVASPVSEGSPVGKDDLVRPGTADGLRAMSLPVGIEHAVGGNLTIGDRVDVISVADETASYIAKGLEVTDVAASGSSGIGSVSAFHVVVAVDEHQALRLAEAVATGEIEIIKSTGAESDGSEEEMRGGN